MPCYSTFAAGEMVAKAIAKPTNKPTNQQTNQPKMETSSCSTAAKLSVGDLVMVRFPSVDKNGTLELNDKRIERDFYIVKCRIERYISLSDEDYKRSSIHLLLPDAIWGFIGGSDLSDEDNEKFLELCKEHGIDSEGSNFFHAWMNVEHLKNWYIQHRFVRVVAIDRRGDPSSLFFVNTEGHDYARVVGRLFGPCTQNIAPNP